MVIKKIKDLTINSNNEVIWSERFDNYDNNYFQKENFKDFVLKLKNLGFNKPTKNPDNTYSPVYLFQKSSLSFDTEIDAYGHCYIHAYKNNLF